MVEGRTTTDTDALDSLETLAQAAIQGANEANAAIAAYLVLVCNQLDWNAAIFYLIDPGSQRLLSPTHQVHLKDEHRTRALELIAKRPPGEDMQGLAGRVLDQGTAAWISELDADPNFTASDFARLLGLHGAIALPIYIGGRLAALAEFFTPRRLVVHDPLLRTLERIGTMLGNRLAALPGHSMTD